jgi:hypothetical protein
MPIRFSPARLPIAHLLPLSLLMLAVGVSWADPAAAQIKQPGAHPRYTVELEPHLMVQHSDNWIAEDEGFGPGLRLSIPLMHNGPIPSINNSLGIGFGLDVAFFDDCRRVRDDDCDARMLWFPVVAQWNFFFTKVVSVFGEAGLGIVHRSADFERGCLSDDCDDTDLDLFQPLFFGGGRFLFSDSVGLVVRLGTPYVSVGATFLL